MKTLLITRKTRGNHLGFWVPGSGARAPFVLLRFCAPFHSMRFHSEGGGAILSLPPAAISQRKGCRTQDEGVTGMDPRTEGCLLIFTWGYLFVALCSAFSPFFGVEPRRDAGKCLKGGKVEKEKKKKLTKIWNYKMVALLASFSLPRNFHAH